ncbi:ATP phosphoribosyltransferase regulatory subunit [Thalassobaculum salexigens]|uniref:ATP phosphoribosyltransferase regulatory subunit n=1 Tax=Thalassobaculum salexigens TaxID=455360 RepID=UPI00248F34BA|nr:ATP phosphoribosyltransferase regulatory subunit [Thalassobaculum salexigens]
MTDDPVLDPALTALLPAGFRDILAPNAANEARLIDAMMSTATGHGYLRVKPPLIEFETSLLQGPGAATAERVFRLMDPISQRMMGLRADMTAQAARIATTRLKNAPRPVRLCYAGEVLRTTANQLNPEREVVQVGAELIGSPTAEADAEIILVAIEALRAVGVERISLDLMVPTLVPSVLAKLGLPAKPLSALRQAIDRKDVAAVEEIAGDGAAVLVGLLEAAGPRTEAMQALSRLDLPGDAREALDRLTEVVELVTAVEPDLSITLDPAENRGFEYHTGIAFSLFARGVRAEMGRGGRYRPNHDPEGTATGFTLYLERVLQALQDPKKPQTVFVPHGTPRDQAAALRRDGRITVAGLTPADDAEAEARRMGCTFILRDGQVAALN